VLLYFRLYEYILHQMCTQLLFRSFVELKLHRVDVGDEFSQVGEVLIARFDVVESGFLPE
jgi:hypothetical protein